MKLSKEMEDHPFTFHRLRNYDKMNRYKTTSIVALQRYKQPNSQRKQKN